MITLHQKLTKEYSYTTEEERTKILTAMHEKIENAISLYKDLKDYKIIEKTTMIGTATKVLDISTNRIIMSYNLIDMVGEIVLIEEFIWKPI